MGNFMNKLQGYKTYITLGIGMVLSVVGHFWGPLTAGPISIPAVDSKTMFECLWGGLSAIFMRHGIATAGGTNTGGVNAPPPPLPVTHPPQQ